MLAKPLARVGDPYVTACGERIAPEGPYVEPKPQPKLTSKSFKATTRRSLRELPAPPDIINGVACVFLYTVLGVGDREIASALKINTTDLKTIRSGAAYAECFESIASEFISANSDLIAARIAAYGHDALTGLADIAFNGKKEDVKLRANIDLLDRGGHTKKESAARGLNAGDGLRIVMIDGEKTVGISIGRENLHG